MGRVVKSVGRIVPAGVVTAKVSAAAILDAASARAEALREQARGEGFEAGRAAADALYTERVAAAAVEVGRLRAQAEPIALKLAAAIAARMAERIVGHAVDVDPAAMAAIAARALGESRARAGIVKLRVHPDDLAALERDPARAQLRSRLGAAVELRVISDAAVGRYGCVVETPSARVDARLATQLAALEKVLVDAEAAGGHG